MMQIPALYLSIPGAGHPQISAANDSLVDKRELEQKKAQVSKNNLIWSNLKIDENTFQGFVTLNAKDCIKVLRDKGIIVLVIKVPFSSSNPNLEPVAKFSDPKYVNEERKMARIFERDIRTSTSAMYLPPLNKNVFNRPLHNLPTIITAPATSSSYLAHEYGHHLIFTKGSSHSKEEQFIQSTSALAKFSNAAFPKPYLNWTSSERIQLLTLIPKFIAYFDHKGSEIDLTRFFLDRKDKLKLSDYDKDHFRNYLEQTYSDFNQKASIIFGAFNFFSKNFKEFRQDPLFSKDKALLLTLKAKLDVTSEWIKRN